MAQNFHNATNIIAKHGTIFKGEETFEFFMLPMAKITPSCPDAEDSSPLTWSLKVQLASLTGSNCGRYHSDPLQPAGVVHWKNRLLQKFGSQFILLLAWRTSSSLDSL